MSKPAAYITHDAFEPPLLVDCETLVRSEPVWCLNSAKYIVSDPEPKPDPDPDPELSWWIQTDNKTNI